MSATARKLGILWGLYFAQGLPYGFQVTALPVYLREAGMSLTGIGLATALAVPWALKIFWGPFIDRYGGGRLGRRRSWIVPLQVGLTLSCAAAAWVDPQVSLTPLLALVLLMNLCAATMDVAVDGLAVDLLELSELGKGNIAQVVGFKIGMLTGGGLLVWASGTIGWRGLFLAMALLVGGTLALMLGYREPRYRGAGDLASPGAGVTLGRVLSLLRRSLTSPGTFWLILFIGSYKTGEHMADSMFRPFLVDAGFAAEQIGLWVGTWGMVFSISGSVAGGLLASRIPLLGAVAVTATLRVLPLAGEWWLSVTTPTAAEVVVVTCAEHFFGGALTTALFAFMMSRVDKRIGATHYTLLAAIEVWGKQGAGLVSGALTDATSYPFLFGLATALSLLFLTLLLPLRRQQRR